MIYPKTVYRTLELAKQLKFTSSCIPEVGQLLKVLVAQVGAGTIAELGTGCGVASSWIIDALQPNQHFISIELDPIKHQSVSSLLQHP